MLQGRKEEKRGPEQPKIFPHDTVYVARANHPRQFNFLIGGSHAKNLHARVSLLRFKLLWKFEPPFK